MTFIKNCVLVIAIYAALTPPLFAQEEQAVADKVAPVAQQLVAVHRLLSGRTSLSLVAVEAGHVEPGFNRDPEFAATTKLFYKGDRFLYDWEFTGPKGPINSRVESYDGEHYESLGRRGGMLTISSKPFLYDIVMCRRHTLFNPFLFLQSAFSTEAYAQLSYNQLTKKDDWTNALASLPSTSRIEEVNSENESYLKISGIGKSIDPNSEQPSVFDVYFAKKFNWYPMKWDRRLLNGDLITSYSVEELDFVRLAGGENIPYPRVSVVKNYVDKRLRDTERIEVKQISFGSVSDDALSIDPASANVIYDQDKGVRINVPK
jgi:hypothetical protein